MTRTPLPLAYFSLRIINDRTISSKWARLPFRLWVRRLLRSTLMHEICNTSKGGKTQLFRYKNVQGREGELDEPKNISGRKMKRGGNQGRYMGIK